MKTSNKKTKKHLYITLAGAVAALVIVVLIVLLQPMKQDTIPSASVAPKGNTTADEPRAAAPSNTPNPGAKPIVKPVATPNLGTPPPKPSLQKSSGNAPGSSVSVGSMVEFTCEGVVNLQCEVVLTDRANPSRIVSLEKKVITSNNRGSYFAIWDWKSVTGSWSVVARVYSVAGANSISDAQILEVK